jgi:hypothetical protein
MEISDVRRRVSALIEKARRSAAERRGRSDQAARDYERFLEHTAVPLFRQVAASLKASGYNFTVFTPAGSVRLMSDKSAEDYVELLLDTGAPQPVVVGHTSHVRGRRVVESTKPVRQAEVSELTDEDVLDFLLTELEPLVER